MMVDKAAVAKILAAGGAVVLPTETVYGLFAKALNQQAVERVYDLKQRPLDKAMNLNVASLKDILAYSKDQPAYLAKLYQAFLPGPLTIILKANDKVPSWVNSGLSTVGFRIPNHPLTRELIREYGPLIGPSANLSGRASGTNFKDIIEQLCHQVIGIADDPVIQGLDSTILDLSGDRAIILRQGTISKEALLEAVPELNF